MAKVAIVRCENYDAENVYQALKRGVDLLGGITRFVKPTERILLKPNLLRPKAPEMAVTTHPAVFAGVIRLLREAGCQAVAYGDSPGHGAPEKVARDVGLSAVAEAADVPLLEFSKGETVSFPQGTISKQFEIAQGVVASDAIISLPKMKTHKLTRITGAIKNQLGCVYGLNKGSFHAKYPNSLEFSQMLVDLNLLLGPRLYIMDGIVAMEGDGPGSGEPIPMNCLIISDDPVAVDATFARLVNLDTAMVPPIVYGEELGLGTATDIEYLGDEVAGFVNPDFDVDRIPVKNEATEGREFSLSHLAKIRGLITRKPVIYQDKCIGCGICIESCPLEDKALSWRPGKKRLPKYDYGKCIRCYCCQEMCPQKAIGVKTPLLGKILIYR